MTEGDKQKARLARWRYHKTARINEIGEKMRADNAAGSEEVEYLAMKSNRDRNSEWDI